MERQSIAQDTLLDILLSETTKALRKDASFLGDRIEFRRRSEDEPNWNADVMPSKRADVYEAKEIARKGPAIWLLKKMEQDVDNWTFEDHDEFIKCMNWRSRLFFDARNRVWRRVRVLQDAYWNTGKQPAELSQAEVKKLLKPVKDKWYESLVISPAGWNSLVGASIIIGAVLYLNPV